MRTIAPVFVAFVSGLILVIAFFFNEETTKIGQLSHQLLDWVIIVGGFTLLLGIVSITRVNWAAVKRRSDGWIYKLFTILAIFVTAIPSILPPSWSPLFGRADGSIYDWLFNYLQAPMMATMFATLAFYIASAAYRAFRARNAEATILLLTATLVMLWRVPMGEAFLNLKTAGESLYDPGDFAQPHDPAFGDISHVSFSVKGEEMVLTKGIQPDILDDHHFVVFFVEKRRIEDFQGILPITPGEKMKGFFHPFRGF